MAREGKTPRLCPACNKAIKRTDTAYTVPEHEFSVLPVDADVRNGQVLLHRDCYTDLIHAA